MNANMNMNMSHHYRMASNSSVPQNGKLLLFSDCDSSDHIFAAFPPRSASEVVSDTSNKFRQLPCRTFISVGTCPYRERCKPFLSFSLAFLF